MPYDLYHAARSILHDECPERPEHRLCDLAEDDGCADCTTCWERCLLALLDEQYQPEMVKVAKGCPGPVAGAAPRQG